jgi:hypothetical protein
LWLVVEVVVPPITSSKLVQGVELVAYCLGQLVSPLSILL